MSDAMNDPEVCERRFVRLLAKVREGKGLLQGELAQRLGKSRSVVAFVETNNRRLKPEEYPLWAEALGVEAQDIETLRMLAYGYRQRDGEWVFWLDWEDPEAYDYECDDPDEQYNGPFDDLATLVNKMSGWDVSRRNGYEATDENCYGLRLNFPHARGEKTFRIDLPMKRLLGDPNEDVSSHVQGTREDLDALVEESTSEQVALTAAFIRGMHAQSRSRLRTRSE